MESNTVRYSLDYKYLTLENTLAYPDLINQRCNIFHSTGVRLERLAKNKCSSLFGFFKSSVTK